jgi:hypothetical protein
MHLIAGRYMGADEATKNTLIQSGMELLKHGLDKEVRFRF